MVATKDNLRADVERLVGQALNAARRRGEAPRWDTTVRPLVLIGARGELAFPWSGDEWLIAADIFAAIERGEGGKWALSTFVYSCVRFALLDLRRQYSQGGITGAHDSVNRSPSPYEHDEEAEAPGVPDLADVAERESRLRNAVPGRAGELLRFLFEQDYDFLNRKRTPLLTEYARLHNVSPQAVRSWYREAIAHPALKRGKSLEQRWRHMDPTTWAWLQRHLQRFPKLPPDEPTRIGDSTYPIAERKREGFRRNDRWETLWTAAALKQHPGITLAEACRRYWIEAFEAATRLRPVSFNENRWRDSWSDWHTLKDQLGGWLWDDSPGDDEGTAERMFNAPAAGIAKRSDRKWVRNDFRKHPGVVAHRFSKAGRPMSGEPPGGRYLAPAPLLLSRTLTYLRVGTQHRKVWRRPGGIMAAQATRRFVQQRLWCERLAESARRRAWFAERAADDDGRWAAYDLAVKRV